MRCTWKVALALVAAVAATSVCAKTIAEVEPNDYEEQESLTIPGLITSTWLPQGLGTLKGAVTINGAIGAEEFETIWGDVFVFTPGASGWGTVRLEGGCSLAFYDCSYFGTAGCAFGYALETTRFIQRMQVGKADVDANFSAGCTYFLHVTSSSKAKYSVKLSLPGSDVSYSITYNANGGTGSASQSGIQKGSTVGILTGLDGKFSRSGYDLVGWATSEARADAGTVDYREGNNITVNSNVILWAVWKKKVTDSLTLSKNYDLGNGYEAFTGSFTVTASGTWSVKKSVSESWVSFSRSGNTVFYTFAQNNGSTERVCVFTVTCGSASATCRVSQSGRTVFLSFDGNGGKISGQAVYLMGTCSAGTLFGNVRLYCDSRYPCTFAGWYTEPKGGTAIADDMSLSSLLSGSGSGLTVYAHWTWTPTVSLSATHDLVGSVRISWNTVSGAQSYKLYRRSTSGSDVLLKASSWSGSYEDNDVEPGLKYGYYLVAAYEELSATSTVVYGMAKPNDSYVISFDSGSDGTWKSTAVMERECKVGVVYALERPYGLACFKGKELVGWQCSNGRRYDTGVLIFNLAEPGETVTMTAIWE